MKGFSCSTPGAEGLMRGTCADTSAKASEAVAPISYPPSMSDSSMVYSMARPAWSITMLSSSPELCGKGISMLMF